MMALRYAAKPSVWRAGNTGASRASHGG